MECRFRTLSKVCLMAVTVGLAGCSDAGETLLEPGENSIEAHGVRGWGADRTDVLSFADLSVVGSSRLWRKNRGVSYVVRTGELEPGHAYTLWIVIFNNTDECLEGAPDGPLCGPGDVVNDAARPDMMWAGGRIANHAGKATFAGTRRVGDSRGSINAPVGLPSYALENASGAEIQFVVHHHGLKLPEYMPDMIKTVDGGCTDAGIPEAGVPSPWNDHEFGRRGPNTCGSVQFAVHSP